MAAKINREGIHENKKASVRGKKIVTKPLQKCTMAENKSGRKGELLENHLICYFFCSLNFLVITLHDENDRIFESNSNQTTVQM